MPDQFTHCKRCGKRIIVKTPGQEYGPKCARILAGQVQLDSMALVSGKVLRKKKDPGKLLVNSGALTPGQLEKINKLPEIS